MSYWLIAIPNEPNPSTTLDRLNVHTSRRGLSVNHEIVLPSLMVGTLDSLMALSEELSKSDPQCEQIAKKIERAYKDIHKQDKAAEAERKAAAGGASSSSSSSEQVPELSILFQGTHSSPRQYSERFHWDEMRYNKRTSLKQLADNIIKEALKADEMLRKTQADYSEVRSQYNQIERLETGSLLVRPLTKYVTAKDLITGREYLDTLLVVVPRARKEEFERDYDILEELAEKAEAQRKKELADQMKERANDDQQNSKAPASASPPNKADNNKDASADQTSASASSSSSSSSTRSKKDETSSSSQTNKKLPCRAIVPGSAKILCDQPGDDMILYRVVVLKPGAENYKILLREKRYTVRPYKHDPEEELKRSEAKKELSKQKTKLYSFLLQWCTTEYSESFSRWLHLKFIRLFVEAVLRYGLPVNFRAVLLEPARGKEKQLRFALRELYNKLAGDNANLTAALDPNETDPSGLGEDFYPYVYLPVNTLNE